MTNSVYIHIPFCSNICSYCNFPKFLYNSKFIMTYLESLKKEIELNYKGELIKTIYIGGGTPSALTLSELEYLFSIIKIFKLDNDFEFTIEVNPDSITNQKLKLFKDNKVNRISIGIESTNNKFLKFLNRNYTYEDVINKLSLIKKYFNNINVDLIYALPNQTLEELENDLDNIIKLDVNHISTYSLILEPNTKLYIDKTKNIDEELDYEMYNLIINKLKNNGFNHYEISNFSKIGYESQHNLVYWHNENYYGFGLGASGYIDNIRYNNTINLNKYNKFEFTDSKEIIDNSSKISYELILGFRLINGINKEKFYNKYKVDIHNLYNIKELLDKKLLIEDKDNIYISYDKIYVENSILINFLEV